MPCVRKPKARATLRRRAPCAGFWVPPVRGPVGSVSLACVGGRRAPRTRGAPRSRARRSGAAFRDTAQRCRRPAQPSPRRRAARISGAQSACPARRYHPRMRASPGRRGAGSRRRSLPQRGSPARGPPVRRGAISRRRSLVRDGVLAGRAGEASSGTACWQDAPRKSRRGRRVLRTAVHRIKPRFCPYAALERGLPDRAAT